jgi:NAD(P)-dependent dehydrogenase (short-subunit alcohol dehydrogenase family)
VRIRERFAGKVMFVTGACGGIARVTSELFAQEGGRIFATDVDVEAGTQLVRRIRATGGTAIFRQCDVTDPDSVAAALRTCDAEYGALNVLFNCAGGTIGKDGSLTETGLDTWRASLDLNLMHVLYTCRHGLDLLRRSRGNAIVNMSSVAAVRGGVGAAMYTAAKGAVISLTRLLAAQGAPYGIRANAVAPGMILTERIRERNRARTGSPDQLPPRIAATLAEHPFSVGEPVDVANIVLFLASDEARMLTGQVINADGGVSAY